ncbi:RrF2 family transcriptional regulator [Xiamenia xianingshaonis]|uniref:Rrf2 family transcriptional regulator n=1 Tax=Xiamenia xianingshaonis TaxID=2682776 RepID=A0A9E6SU73_9ACTN|nr:Rrf2 family transcriptional regulator [Xiamenia xianingshaonis]NGM18325.1 Rrf2 family transcriptional regulator [Eggerthellaceae bacterium zg-893]NHM14145.1 Rrf2 family transcriptional regulator [Xiamenia xianingshaonis]QTU84235.1 Rrf2 family transcriptional regulator [Xiamenia xianingshaonis]
MQFKASTDYGIRAILYLAAQGTTCSSRDIAEDMSIPRDYLIQLAQLLRNAGIIEARPGKHGGYRLAKDPSDISVLDVMNALEEDSRQQTRERRADRKGGEMVEEVKLAYDLIGECFDAFMASLTMDSLLDCVENKGGSRAYLSNRLQEEARRLMNA